MDAMPRPRPPYLHRFKTRHENYIWYVRKGAKGKRIRLHGEYGSDEFWAAYNAALLEKSREPAVKAAAGTVAWLWERYRETGDWSKNAPATRRQRENIMGGVLKTIGEKPVKAVTQASIIASLDKRAKTPFQARNFLDAMKGLFRWAKKAKHVAIDPTLGVEAPQRPKGGQGFPVWTEEEIDRYYARWPLGTRERVWMDVALYTGLRRGDLVAVGRQHVKDGAIVFRTEKSKESVAAVVPMHPELEAVLAAGPCGELAFICNENGKPFTKESFGNAFRKACRAAGIKKSAHGLRKAIATRIADNGGNEFQLMATMAWTDPKMAQLYTKTANRNRIARSAATLFGRTENERESCPPHHKVGTTVRIK